MELPHAEYRGDHSKKDLNYWCFTRSDSRASGSAACHQHYQQQSPLPDETHLEGPGSFFHQEKEPVSFECELSSQAQMFKRLVLNQFVRESTGSFGGGEVAARSGEPSHRPLRVTAWPHFHFEQSIS